MRTPVRVGMTAHDAVASGAAGALSAKLSCQNRSHPPRRSSEHLFRPDVIDASRSFRFQYVVDIEIVHLELPDFRPLLGRGRGRRRWNLLVADPRGVLIAADHQG